MIITLPTKNGPIDFTLDVSAYAHYRFEQYFGEQLKCSFQEYLERIAKSNQTGQANYISILKALYCWLESEKAPTFEAFLKLFDPTHSEYEKMISELKKAFDEIFRQVQNSATKN